MLLYRVFEHKARASTPVAPGIIRLQAEMAEHSLGTNPSMTREVQSNAAGLMVY